jgi:serine/threonine protein kinase
MVHRDLKPANILINQKGHALIADLGTCREESMTLLMTGGIGTPLYQAPEMMEDKPSYGPPVDVFAFAIMLWEMVTEKLVILTHYKGMTAFHIGNCVQLGKRPLIPADVNPQTAKLINDCWQHNPRSRPTFNVILQTLTGMNYQLIDGVDSAKVAEFVQQVLDQPLAVGKD